MIQLKQASLIQGTKVLLETTSVTLQSHQKTGIIGRNGCGKSTLLAALQKQISLQQGEILYPSDMVIAAITQETPALTISALEYVTNGDLRYAEIQQQLKTAEQLGEHQNVAQAYDRLLEIDGYTINQRAAKLLYGLGFRDDEITLPVKSFSGGWRMRLNLARCLIAPADLLILDEPTNHLDLEALIWLESYLKQCRTMLLLVSHDRDFLDGVVTHILHFQQQKLKLYTGNYSAFEEQRAHELQLEAALYAKQQVKITHMMKFVNRFRAKATKAKQAQSRLKAIEKMDLVVLSQQDSPIQFDFFEPEKLPQQLLNLEHTKIGYQQPLLEIDHLVITQEARIGLLGVNGVGKSSFIKTIAGKLNLLSGKCEYSVNTKIGYFAQHQVDELSLSLTVLETLAELAPTTPETSLRRYLGGFGFSQEMVFAKVRQLSGGEKARLALAKIIWLKPNLLLLDEPTNHLDFDMRSALVLALQSYQGGLIVISHDRYFLRTTVDEFWLAHAGTVKPYQASLEDYQQFVLTTSNNNNPVNKKAIEHKSNSRNIERETLKLEKEMAKIHERLKAVTLQLSDEALYQQNQHFQIQELINKQKILENELAELENEWYRLQEN